MWIGLVSHASYLFECVAASLEYQSQAFAAETEERLDLLLLIGREDFCILQFRPVRK